MKGGAKVVIEPHRHSGIFIAKVRYGSFEPCFVALIFCWSGQGRCVGHEKYGSRRICLR